MVSHHKNLFNLIRNKELLSNYSAIRTNKEGFRMKNTKFHLHIIRRKKTKVVKNFYHLSYTNLVKLLCPELDSKD